MICPYCEQGSIVKALIRKSKKEIYICEECDTVWEEKFNFQAGIGFDTFMRNNDCEPSWKELEIKRPFN